MMELEENVIYFLVEIYIFEISACKNKKRRSVFFFFEKAILSPKGSFSDEKKIKQLLQNETLLYREKPAVFCIVFPVSSILQIVVATLQPIIARLGTKSKQNVASGTISNLFDRNDYKRSLCFLK